LTRLFISYRRADSQHAVDRLYEGLRRHLPKKDIFIDVDNIPKGVDFSDYLSRYVAQCQTLLAIIGPQWLTLKNEAGNRRLDDPDDFVRIEIAAALKRGIPVVPVLLDGTRMPRRDELPDDLKGLERRNAAFLNRDSFKADMAGLIGDLGLKPRRTWQVPVIAGGVMAALGLAALFATGVLPPEAADPPQRTAVRTDPPAAEPAIGELLAVADASELPAPMAPAELPAREETAPAATLAAHRAYLANPENERFRAEAEVAVSRHEAAVLRLQTALSA
jgi:hypothetical protein